MIMGKKARNSNLLHKVVFQIEQSEVLVSIQKSMIVKVTGIFALFHGTHPPISDTEANEVNINLASKLRGIRFGQVNAVAQSGHILAPIRLSKYVKVPRDINLP